MQNLFQPCRNRAPTVQTPTAQKEKRRILRFNAFSLVRSRELESRALWLKGLSRQHSSNQQFSKCHRFLFIIVILFLLLFALFVFHVSLCIHNTGIPMCKMCAKMCRETIWTNRSPVLRQRSRYTERPPTALHGVAGGRCFIFWWTGKRYTQGILPRPAYGAFAALP